MSITRDDVLYGVLSLRQPVDGPRINVDTILLAAYVRDTFPRGGGKVLELGCASGAVSLILAFRFPSLLSVHGLDIQDDLVRLANGNAALNSLSDRVSFTSGDLRNVRSLFLSQDFDCVLLIPPTRSPEGADSVRQPQSVQPGRGFSAPFPTLLQHAATF